MRVDLHAVGRSRAERESGGGENARNRRAPLDIGETAHGGISGIARKIGAVALRAGMPSLAKAIVGDAIESGNIPKELESGFDAILVDALIAQGAFEDAKKLFAKIDSKSPPTKSEAH